MKSCLYTNFSWLILLSTVIVLFLGLGAEVAYSQESPKPIELTQEQRRALANGEVLVEATQGKLNRGVAIGVVKAPIAEVWPIVTDCENYKVWRDNMRNTKIISRSEKYEVCKGVVTLPFPARNRHGNMKLVHEEITLGGKQYYHSSYLYIKGSGNVEQLFGYWLLEPFGENHTLIKHVLNGDIGGWLPDFLVRWVTSRILPDTIIGVRDRHSQLHRK